MSTFRAYLITPPAGSSSPRQWHTVAAEAGKIARELGGTAEALELPATKAALLPFLNSLEAEHAAELERLKRVDPLFPNAPAAEPAPIGANDDDELPARFDARVLEAQVTALGDAGEKGLEQLEQLAELTGIGAAFSRGVHLLTIAAAGDHQLARIFRRLKARG